MMEKPKAVLSCLEFQSKFLNDQPTMKELPSDTPSTLRLLFF